MRAALKGLLGVVLVGVVFTAGCFALLRASMEVGERSVQEERQGGIYDEEARGIQLGTPRSQVVGTLGEPRETREGENDDPGANSCLYYNVRGGMAVDSWQFCFDRRNRLTRKNRL